MAGPRSPSSEGTPCAGIDGCRAGWIVATDHGCEVVESLADTLPRFGVVAIDMPIGLPESGTRAADADARRFLSPRGSTVFPTPLRATLGAPTHAEACRRSLAAGGTRLSIQAFHLLPRIAELDALVTPDDEARVFETHPECAFAAMNGGPLPTKHSATGLQMRRALLAQHGLEPSASAPRGATAHDLLDAHALLWSARRIARGEHVVLGDGARDGRCLVMRIVY